MNTEKIFSACKEAVENRLKCPATAKYPKLEIVEEDSFGKILLDVEVDSQNAFGALVRTKLWVVLYKKDDEYYGKDISVYKKSFINTQDVVKSVNKWDKEVY